MRKLVIMVAAFMGLSGLSAQAQNLALVLSNGYYENGADVANISRRHRQLVSAFEGQGYEVIQGVDSNRLEMRQALNQFESKLADADVAVISLQGHVAHFGQRSWYLPADIDANSATGVEFRAVSLDFFAQLLADKPGQSVMFVGESGREIYSIPQVEEGLVSMNLPRGVMMVSGAYNEISDVIKNKFMRRNARVIDVLRGDIGRLEIEGDIPASLVLANGRGAVATPETVEERLGLNSNQRKQIQRDLTALGYDTRGIDGVFGGGTRNALADWQRRKGLSVSGYITADQIVLLREQADEARVINDENDRRYWALTGADGSERGLGRYLERYPNGLFANRARAELARLNADSDEEAWAQAVRIDTPESYRQYLEDFPNGDYKNIARSRIGSPPEVVENDAKRVEDALRLNSITRLLIEQRISDLGYRAGPRDGNFDLASRQAFRRFQQDRGMPVTGYVTADMIRRLLLNQ